MSKQKFCKCGAPISRRALRCHTCANRRTRPGRRTISSTLPSALYLRLSAVVRNAIIRCTDKDGPAWHRYGGRGVTVCKKWLDDPAKFVEHLTTLVGHDNPRLVIDREDNSKGYEPGNIRFVTRSVSQRNKDPYGLKATVKVGVTYGSLTVVRVDTKADCICACGRSVRVSLGVLAYPRKNGGGRCCPSCGARRAYAARKPQT